jgi:hypothetical protein
VSTALTAPERRALETLEGIVQRGIDTFVDVGRALAEIRDRRLYRQTHGTFEEYCHEKWLLGRTRAYQLIDAAMVSTIVDSDPPSNEAQARELVPLKDDETEVVAAWREAKAEAEELGTSLTAKVVRIAVRKRLGRVKRERQAAERREEHLKAEPTACCDGCGRTEYAATSMRDSWVFPGWERGSHGDHYEHTYCRACVIASGLAAEDARQYADDLDAGRGHCDSRHGWTEGEYRWGGWACLRREAEAGRNGGSS